MDNFKGTHCCCVRLTISKVNMGSIGTGNPYECLTIEDSTSHKKRKNKSKNKNKKKNKSESVQVSHPLSFPDSKGSTEVQRHLPITQLREITPVCELAAAVGSQEIHVSPARSACTDTEVTVNVSFASIIAKAREDLRAEMESKFGKVVQDLSSLSDAVTATNWSVHLADLASMRLIEDLALKRMKTVQGLSESTSHKEIVSKFVRDYSVPGIRPQYLSELANSELRERANDAIHLKPIQKEELQMMWKCLAPRLTPEERGKYRALLDFGTRKMTIHFKQGDPIDEEPSRFV